MNIIVLTSYMEDSYFSSYLDEASIKPNPSNQNFYYKLIQALKINNDIDVISLRPFAKNMFAEKKLNEKYDDVDGIHYFYPQVKTSIFYKLLFEKNYLYKAINNYIANHHLRDFIIVVDPLRINLGKVAIDIKKRYGKKCVAVLTDNPNNLSSVNRHYKKQFNKYIQNFDGYISLTRKLNELFNPADKPCYFLEGLALEMKKGTPKPLGKYIFFGGSLYEKYGVKNLLEAYKEIDIPYRLVIAGDGKMRKEIYNWSERIDTRVLYLGMVNRETIENLEQFAELNINPRPFSKTLDEESIPSKVIEYLSSGTLTMTTMNTPLYNYFKNEAIWLNGDSVIDIKNGLLQFNSMSKDEKRNMAKKAKSKAIHLYGMQSQSAGLMEFLVRLKKTVIY